MDRRGRADQRRGKRGSLLGESLRLLGWPAYFVLVNLLPFLFLGVLFFLNWLKIILKGTGLGNEKGVWLKIKDF